MNQSMEFVVPGLVLDSPSMRNLERMLSRMVKVMVGYSAEAPSRRIEGQFGSDIMEEQFSDMSVYLQCSSILEKAETLESIIRGIYKSCCVINRHYSMPNQIYLFNVLDHQIKLASRNMVSYQAYRMDQLAKAIVEFQPAENVRMLSRLNRFEENTLLIFITDSQGCELSEELAKRYRRARDQAIWVKVREESMEIRRGFPCRDIDD